MKKNYKLIAALVLAALFAGHTMADTQTITKSQPIVVADASTDAATTAEQKANAPLFFEPTDAEYNTSNDAIMAQQDAYNKAKAAGNYDKAVDLALFHWTRAWLHFNKAMSTIETKGAWESKDSLNEALDYLKLAETDAKATTGVESRKVLAKVSKNRDTINEQLKNLDKRAERKAARAAKKAAKAQAAVTTE